ncbi:recombinase family protein [Paenibacillus sp. LPE1-1-1.1]
MARVSTKEQNLERQLIKFKELGIDERYIFVDKHSGKDFNRPQYQAIRKAKNPIYKHRNALLFLL